MVYIIKVNVLVFWMMKITNCFGDIDEGITKMVITRYAVT